MKFFVTVAQRRAIDCLRKRSKPDRDYDQLFDDVAHRLEDNKVGEAWRQAVSKHDGRRMMYLIRDAIASMPKRQRQVASVMINSFPDAPSLGEIRQTVQAMTGEELSLTSVKRARQEARQKIHDRLVREGYME